MTAPPTPDDVLLAAFVIFTALVAFIAILYLNRKQGRKEAAPKSDLQGELEGGTVLVEEGGKVVRRSTRQHKPIATTEDGLANSPKTPRAARASAAAATPITAARTPRTTERMTSPTRGRKAATAKSPGPARRAAKSPAATPSSPRSTRRGRAA